MRTFYTILFSSFCLFYACQETIDFQAFEGKELISLKENIRFDQLAIGQKSTYILIKLDDCGAPSCCQQSLDTLHVEIIEQDTNGYLVKETTNLRHLKEPFFFYLKYESRQILRDTLENEPSVKEYEELIAIKTEAINEEYRNQVSSLFKQLGAKLYLNTSSQKSLINQKVENVCKVFFLPDREDDPLPFRDNVYHSELGVTKDYQYGNNCYGDLLVTTHDYGYVVDACKYNYGYSLSYGLVFSGAFDGSYLYGDPQVWHIIPD